MKAGATAIGLFLGGVLLLAAVAYADDWFTGNEDVHFFALALLALSALVFAFAADVSARQVNADARRELLRAREQVIDLKAKVVELERKIAESKAAVTTLAGTGAPPGQIAIAQREVDDVQARAAAANVELTSVMETLGNALKELPEGHRLSGAWVAAAVTLAVLAVIVVKDISLSTSTPTPPAETPPTAADGTESGEDTSSQEPDENP